MEDLGDETLAQISTPTRTRGAPNSQNGPLQARAVSRPSLDDSEDVLSRRGQLQNRGGSSAIAMVNGVAVNAPGPAVQDEDEATRKMFDKRELRKRHRGVFDERLAAWRAQHAQAASATQPPSACSQSARVRVCLRKRPLFPYEVEADQFDVVTVRGAQEVVVHNCLTKADLRSLFVSHMGFHFSNVFGEAATDDAVYAQCSAPAVRQVLSGGVATLFMFGQTGSGKTHTMAGLIRRAAEHLFRGGVDEGATKPATFCLAAFEIAGKTMRDLLDMSPKELKVMEDKSHFTHVLGISCRDATSPEDLLHLMESAQNHRTTRATQVNDTSSRSHAVYRIYMTREARSGDAPPAPGGPVLTLVDCAGSERREDSSHHDIQSRKDAAEINSTIFALKECFRVMRSSKGQQPPYRDSLLTRVLSDSFSSERAMIVAIGTVSPSATDTEHSIGTLRALQQLQGTSMTWETREDIAKPRAVELPHPRTWSEDEVRQWVESALGGRAREHASALTKGTDGKNLARWNEKRFVQLCGGDEDLGARLYADLKQRGKASGGQAAS